VTPVVAALKSILRNGLVVRAVCWLGAQYIRLVWVTGRWRTIGGDIPREYWNQNKPFIGVFWHGRILMMPCSWDYDNPINMLISSHRDGQLISRTVSHFGIDTIAGSTRRGGSGALRAMLGALKKGQCVAITPDGPRGPRMRASVGVANSARLAQVPVIPVTFGATRRRLVSSWDRFVVALPFTRGVIIWGNPTSIARDADEEAVERGRQQIEDELNRITAEADRLCDVAPVEPAAPSAGTAAAAS
jgi:lysophospholipid acyltransferase (LPLAT)-like uncharacterized protein